MKYVAMLSVVFLLSGCGVLDRASAGITGYSRVCVDGVSYLQFTSGVTVEYDKSGSIKLCND